MQNKLQNIEAITDIMQCNRYNAEQLTKYISNVTDIMQNKLQNIEAM